MQTLRKSSEFDIISLHNITDDDFVFEYDKSAGNPPYLIPANTVRRYPRFLAEHALKHLIDKILTKKKMKTNNDTERQDLASQIVVSEETFQSGPIKTEAERTQEMVREMNKPSDLENILKKNQEKAKAQETKETVDETVLPEDKEEETFEGLEKPKVEEVKAVPSRNEIFAYAENTLKMTIDEKTRKEWNKMKIEDLIREVGDPRDKLA